MELPVLIERARARDVAAFTELTRRYQNMAFGYAYAVLGDFHLAEDAVQEAFLATYFDLAKLQEPGAFPGWLRGIVRHQCHRILRRQRLAMVPLEQAASLEADGARPERHLEQQEDRAAVLAAIDALPQSQREVVTLYYIEEYSHQEIARFLDVPVTTVNNRLHAARARLKRRLLPMAQDIFKANALPDDFAARIGRIVQTRGPVIEAQFDPAELPEVLSALTLSDEPRQIDVTVEVIQRVGNGVVRCIATSPIRDLSPSAKVVPTGQPASVPIGHDLIESAVTALASPGRSIELVETGIKVIDLLSPYARGGRVGIFGDPRVGKLVLIEELVRSLAARDGGLSLFTFVHAAEVPVVQEHLPQHPRLATAVEDAPQAFYLLSDRPSDPEYAAALAFFDAVTYLSREIGAAGIWPAVDPLASTSRLLDPAIVGQEHFEVAQRVRQALLRANELEGDDVGTLPEEDQQLLSRVHKLRRFFSQPFVVAEPFTNLPGRSVSRMETVQACRAILDGAVDDLSEEAFHFVGGLDEVREKVKASAPATDED